MQTKAILAHPVSFIKVLWRHQFLRFLMIGAVNTLFSYCLYASFIYLGFSYVLASLCATIIGVIFNFKTIGKFVFAQEDKNLIWRFMTVYTITYFINISFIKIGTCFSSNLYLIGAISTFLVAMITYLLHKNFVFGKLNPALQQ